MTNLEQSKRLKDAGWNISDDDITLMAYGDKETPSEKQMMEWLQEKTKSNFDVDSEITQDDLPYWSIWLLLPKMDEAIEVKHADLTEALVMAVEAVLKGAK